MESAKDLSVYIHWPFCQTVCPYCDFNVHAATDINQEAWRAALLSEIAHYGTQTTGRAIKTIYFGGGTPSLMPPQTVDAVIQKVADTWPVSNDAEITIEINPTSAAPDQMRAFKAAGVNRVSIGVQSFDDEALRFLGRDHSGATAKAAVDVAQSLFDRVTFDLMYALPDQSVPSWQEELTAAVSMGCGHLSLYQLTIEPGTPFARNDVAGLDEDAAADLFDVTQDILSGSGLAAYEVSNHAKSGDESRHNLHGWRGGDYVGVGPGAHGRLTIGERCVATHQIHNPARWLERVQTDGHGTAKERPLSAADRARERMMMGLRLAEGIDIADIERETLCPRETFIDVTALDYIVEGGLLRMDKTRLRTTDEGRLRLNAVLSSLLVF